MLSIKERRFALEYVKDPETKPTDIIERITNKRLSRQACSTKAKKYLASPEVQEYIESLQSSVAKQLNLTQLKQIKKLQKIYKQAMKPIIDAQGNSKPVNLSAAITALDTINRMTGMDQVQKASVKLPNDVDYDDAQYAEKILVGLMKQYMSRELDKEDLDSLMKSLDTLATYRLGSKLEAQLIKQPQNKSLFDKKEDKNE